MMENAFLDLAGPLAVRQAMMELEQCSPFLGVYGLTLTHGDAVRLAETKENALRTNGRLEFGGGTLKALLFAFCDSPHFNGPNWLESMQELMELFYELKNEIPDSMTDDELITKMRSAFNGSCGGSMELLEESMLRMARLLRGWEPSDEELGEGVEPPYDGKELKD